MKSKKLHLHIHILCLLAACAPAAWGQAPFGDHIMGDASACKAPSYDKSGSTKLGYYLTGVATAPGCDSIGPATAKAQAQVGEPALAASATTTTLTTYADPSTNHAWDEAILTPPAGWTGPVAVELDTSYSWSVQGVTSTALADFMITWQIRGTATKHTAQSQKNGGAQDEQFSTSFNVDPDTDGSYSFILDINGVATATNGSTVKFKTSFINLVLPDDWEWTWASNQGGHAFHNPPE